MNCQYPVLLCEGINGAWLWNRGLTLLSNSNWGPASIRRGMCATLPPRPRKKVDLRITYRARKCNRPSNVASVAYGLESNVSGLAFLSLVGRTIPSCFLFSHRGWYECLCSLQSHHTGESQGHCLRPPLGCPDCSHQGLHGDYFCVSFCFFSSNLLLFIKL